jgi:hypothetical protein
MFSQSLLSVSAQPGQNEMLVRAARSNIKVKTFAYSVRVQLVFSMLLSISATVKPGENYSCSLLNKSGERFISFLFSLHFALHFFLLMYFCCLQHWNVYDILKKKTLVLTPKSLEWLAQQYPPLGVPKPTL